MRYDDQLQQHITRIYRARALASVSSRHALFRRLPEEQLRAWPRRSNLQLTATMTGRVIISASRRRAAHPEKEPVIVNEGDYPNGVVIVRAGFARVSHKFGSGERT